MTVEHKWEPSDRLRRLAERRGVTSTTAPWATIQEALNAAVFSVRIYNGLVRHYRDYGQLDYPFARLLDDIRHGEVLGFRNLGRESYNELCTIFREYL